MTQQTYSDSTPPTRQPDAIDRFFGSVRRIGVTRTVEGKWFGGVAAGLARRWGVDPLIVRAGFLLATVLFGFGVPAYFIAWCLLPDEQNDIAAEKALRHGDFSSIVLCIVAIVLSLSGFGIFWSFGSGWGFGGPVIGLAFLAWAFLAWNGRGPGARRPDESAGEWTDRLKSQIHTDNTDATSPGNRAAAAGAAAREAGIDLHKDADTTAPYAAAPPVAPTAPTAPITPTAPAAPIAPVRPKRPRLSAPLTLVILGISVLAGAFTALVLVSTSHGESALQVGLAVGAAVAAIALVIGGLAGRRGGALGPLATLAVLAALALAAVAPKGMPWTGTIGDESWNPTSVAAGTQHNFAMRIGNGNLDLSGLDATTLPAHTQLHARVNVGQLTITAPADVTLRVKGYAHMGEIETVRGYERITGHGGIDNHQRVTVGSGPKVIDLDASVAMGNITIKEAQS